MSAFPTQTLISIPPGLYPDVRKDIKARRVLPGFLPPLHLPYRLDNNNRRPKRCIQFLVMALSCSSLPPPKPGLTKGIQMDVFFCTWYGIPTVIVRSRMGSFHRCPLYPHSHHARVERVQPQATPTVMAGASTSQVITIKCRVCCFM